MPRFRSILWIGRPGPVARQVVSGVPSLEVAWARDAEEAMELPLAAFDAVVLDAPEPEAVIPALPKLAAAPRRPRLVVLLGAATTGSRGRLLQAGADEVIPLGEATFSPADLEAVFASERNSRPAGVDPSDREIVAESASMRRTLALADRARRTQATVLLCGETGTGKEVLARSIHRGSARSQQAFVAINCAAFPDSLLESELSGHVRGAFTGADRDKRGLFEEADGGVLLLDEVGETSPSLQAKLLRALQEREVRAVGGTRSRSVDVRLLAATNRDLQSEVQEGRFRKDLYYRLAVFPIEIPPLRRRREDVLPLARHFLARFGLREGKPECGLDGEAEALLVAHAWPGNVRELENEMQRCLALVEPGEVITPAHLSERVAGALEPLATRPASGESLRESMNRVEAWLIRRGLDRNDGRRAITARQLGVTREGLYNYIPHPTSVAPGEG